MKKLLVQMNMIVSIAPNTQKFRRTIKWVELEMKRKEM